MFKLKSIAVFAALLFVALSFNSCKNDDFEGEEYVTDATGSLSLMIENTFDNHDLLLDSNYVTGANDTINFTTFKYYITNVTLTGSDVNNYAIPDGNYLVESTSSNNVKMAMPSIPVGTYDSISFTVGVDSLFNLVEANDAGDLDPNGSDGMLWVWGTDQANSGYKFIRIEGTYNNSPENALKWHVGTNDNVKTYKMALSPNLIVTDDGTNTIHMMAMCHKLFDNIHSIDVNEVNDVTVMPIDQASQIADNYGTGMFMIHHIEN